MERCGRTMWWGLAVPAVALVVFGLVHARPAHATLKYGPIELSGSVDSQTLIRTISIDEYQFVQNRNTALIRLDYDWLRDGKFIDRYQIPGVKRSKPANTTVSGKAKCPAASRAISCRWTPATSSQPAARQRLSKSDCQPTNRRTMPCAASSAPG